MPKKEIKKRFYELSMRHVSLNIVWHPDRNQNDEAAHAKFLEINEAYSVLGDDLKRRDYDREIASISQSSGSGPSAYPSRSGPRNTAGRYQRHSNLRPEDWVQQRRSASAYGQQPPPKSPFDFAQHAESHYGDKQEIFDRNNAAYYSSKQEQLRTEREYRRKYFKGIRDVENADPKFFGILVVVTTVFVLWEMGLIQMIWAEPRDASQLEYTDDLQVVIETRK
eukprot:jgi/Hompol1/38/HPOL_000832-RA